MSHRIARFFEPLLRLLRSGRGRHRHPAVASGRQHLASYADAPSTRQAVSPPLRGEDNSLVRPYLLAHERREEALRQRARRRTLLLAVHGIDVGPCVIHKVAVTA